MLSNGDVLLLGLRIAVYNAKDQSVWYPVLVGPTITRLFMLKAWFHLPSTTSNEAGKVESGRWKKYQRVQRTMAICRRKFQNLSASSPRIYTTGWMLSYLIDSLLTNHT